MSRLPALGLSVFLFALVAGASSAATAVPRLLSCGGKPLLRPSGTVVLACADANTEIRDTSWASWTRSTATGTTDFGLNLCTPTCAASRISFFPKSPIRLAGARKTAQGLLFSRATITYTLHGRRRTFTAYPRT